MTRRSFAKDLPSYVLLMLGFVDLLRGVLHTFFIDWANRTFAHLDLSANGADQLVLLSAFGISNFLTGFIYILISRRAGPLSEFVLLLIPSAYGLGWLGMQYAGVKPEADFYGRYFVLGYLGICLATPIVSRVCRDRGTAGT